MKLKTMSFVLTIGDDSEEAKKILQGYGYSLINGKLMIKSKKEDFDLDNFEKKVKNNNHDKQDTDKFLLELIKIYKKIKWNIE